VSATSHVIVEFIGLFLAGLLAGVEFVVRYGVQPALGRLEDRAHLLARIALVHRMRFVVPALIIPTVVAAIVTVVLDGTNVGCWFRWTGLAALIAFLVIAFAGTVPINIKVIDWDADNPPADWKAVIRRWELIDIYRSTAAILAFALFLSAAARQLTG
jgi:uncharacterized membrane protein